MTPRFARFPLFAGVIASISGAACSGSSTEATTPESETTAEPTGTSTEAATSSAPKEKEDKLPAVVTTCEKNGDICVPPLAFVKKLCANVNPDLALVYFRKGSPFSRGWLTRNTEVFNAFGGSSSQDKLFFDEEVIVVNVRAANTTGIQVSGASGGYDVIRWDGSCASLPGEELTFKAPPKSKNAKLEWKTYSDDSQNALLNDANIAKINKQRRDECKGVTIGDVSKACVKAVDQLSEAIVAFVREGGEVPVPKALK